MNESVGVFNVNAGESSVNIALNVSFNVREIEIVLNSYEGSGMVSPNLVGIDAGIGILNGRPLFICQSNTGVVKYKLSLKNPMPIGNVCRVNIYDAVGALSTLTADLLNGMIILRG